MNEFTTKMQVCHAQPRQKRISRQKRTMPITESEGEKRGSKEDYDFMLKRLNRGLPVSTYYLQVLLSKTGDRWMKSPKRNLTHLLNVGSENQTFYALLPHWTTLVLSSKFELLPASSPRRETQAENQQTHIFQNQ